MKHSKSFITDARLSVESEEGYFGELCGSSKGHNSKILEISQCTNPKIEFVETLNRIHRVKKKVASDKDKFDAFCRLWYYWDFFRDFLDMHTWVSRGH